MKNKKSIIVVKALVRIIIAVVVLFLIVIPACNKIRSLFIGGVGSGPYEELLKSVDEISRADDGEAVTQLFELDRGTAVLVFKSSTDSVIVDHQGRDNWFTRFYKPNECEGNFACICKCTEFDIDYEITGVFGARTTYRNAVCRAGMESCKTFKTYEVNGTCEIKEIGSGENIVVATSGDDPWKCTQGVYIGREVEKNGNGVVDTKSPERRIIRIENVGGIVYVCENPDPSDGCVPPLPAP